VPELEQTALTGIVQTARQGGWWELHGDVLDEQFRELLALESAASEILLYDAQQVPELLQTPRYARAVADVSVAPPGDVSPKALAGITAGRQRAVFGERRARVVALIGEAALRTRAINGEVMQGQAERLAEISEASAETVIRILPLLCGAPSCAPVAVLRFSDASNLGAVYLRGLSGNVCLAGQQDVASYTRAFEQAKAIALSADDSAQLLREMMVG